MATAIQRYLSIPLTQAGADTFVQGSVTTDILPENGLVYKVLSIEFALITGLLTLTADFFATWSLSRDTKTAVANTTDPDSFLWDGFSLPITTSGMAYVPQRFDYLDRTGIYIVEPTVYGQFNCAGGVSAISSNFRIYYEEVKLSEVEILRILNNS